MKRACLIAFLVSISLVGLVGCQQQRAWVYQPNARSSDQPVLAASLVVPPFTDSRDNVNKNRIAVGYIPLVPYGWQEYKVPESSPMHITSTQWTFNPKEDFAKAVAAEIENARIFRETFFSYKRSDGDWVLDGQIISTNYDGKLYMYCVSLFAPYLWMVGLPAGSVQNELTLELTLSNAGMPQPAWRGKFARTQSMVTWIYGMKADFTYDLMLKSIMDEALPQIRGAVKTAAQP